MKDKTKLESSRQTMLTHLRHYKILEELENAGELDATSALVKLWKYDHLHLHTQHSSLLPRIQFEIGTFYERLLGIEDSEV